MTDTNIIVALILGRIEYLFAKVTSSSLLYVPKTCNLWFDLRQTMLS